jgi:hypothetical protein
MRTAKAGSRRQFFPAGGFFTPPATARNPSALGNFLQLLDPAQNHYIPHHVRLNFRLPRYPSIAVYREPPLSRSAAFALIRRKTADLTIGGLHLYLQFRLLNILQVEGLFWREDSRMGKAVATPPRSVGAPPA